MDTSDLVSLVSNIPASSDQMGVHLHREIQLKELQTDDFECDKYGCRISEAQIKKARREFNFNSRTGP